MDELVIKLNNISDSYFAFVAGVLAYVREDPSHLQMVSDYIDSNPDALSSDVLGFVMHQPDFIKSAASETSA